MRCFVSTGMVAAFLLFAAMPGRAQEITFNFTAVIDRIQVDGVDLPNEGSFAIGQAVTGSYSFDSTAIDEDQSSEVGLYRNVTRFEAIVPDANYHARTAAGSNLGFIEILDNQDGVRDRYVASAPGPFQIVSGVNLAGRPLDRLAVVLRDRTTLALSSDALPVVPPTLTDFASGTEVFLDFGPSAGVSAELTSLTIGSVITLLDDLVQRVIALNVQRGMSNSLDAKLHAVMSAIDDANEKNNVAAQNAMYAFMNAVEAQRGKKLTETQADQLLSVARAIIAALGG